MKKIYEELLEKIPEYSRFLTVEEMNRSSHELAKKYPEIVQLNLLGFSRQGEPIYELVIGSGKEHALFYGCPHPNEPIGAMMIEYFSEALAKNSAFRETLNYTFHLIKTIDPDGTALNEGWFKGPFNLETYANYFFRPDAKQQADWTFPIDYKTLKFTKPIAETKILMKLVDDYQPKFIYSLHNSGFGGAYWYITHPLKDLHESFYKACERVNIPVNFGKPEVPFAHKFGDAIYRSISAKDMYNYAEDNYPEGIDPASNVSAGTSIVDYAQNKYEPVSIICEVPYYFDQRSSDTSKSKRSKKEIMLDNLNYQSETIQFIENIYHKLKISDDNTFKASVMMYINGVKRNNMMFESIEKNEAFNELASQAEVFDYFIMSRFYMGLLAMGSFARLLDIENSQFAIDVKEKMKKIIEEINSRLDYRFLEIKDVISVQLESGILILDYIQDKEIGEL